MKRKAENNPKSEPMDQELDRILLNEDPLLPSSGFAASVMQQVEQSASQTDPIPFPWKRAIPGFAAIAVALGLLVWLAAGTFFATTPAAAQTDSQPFAHLNLASANALLRPLAPAALALAGAWLCALLARRMVGEGSSL